MSRRRRRGLLSPLRLFRVVATWAVLGLTAMILWQVVAGWGTRAPESIPEDAVHGVVDRVVDGDTLHVRTDAGEDLTVRLIGVDTPETVKPDTAVQCFGPEASEYSKQLLPSGSSVYLEYDSSQGDVDRYGRTLAYVWHVDSLEGASTLNYDLIVGGFGREYTYDTAYRYQAAFRAAQDAAESGGVGLWSACTTTSG